MIDFSALRAFDVVKLKTGAVVTIVEVLRPGEAYLVDDNEQETVDVALAADISSVEWRDPHQA